MATTDSSSGLIQSLNPSMYMTQRKLKIMADYQCFPLWGSFDDNDGNIDPATLPITDKLQFLLSKWQAAYDGILNIDDPMQSGFKTHQDEIAFEEQGLLIWQLLAVQMGELYTVSYFSELKNKEFFNLSDYNN